MNLSKKEMGETDNELEHEILNLDNWTIEVNEDVVEKAEQEAALRNWMKEWSDLAKDCAKNKMPNIEMSCSVDGRINEIVFGNENDSADGFDVRLNYEVGKLPRKLKKAMKQVADGLVGRRGSKWINRWMFVRKRYKSYLFKNCRFGTADNDDVGFDGSALTMKVEFCDYGHN